MKTEAIIIDLDGTLCNADHRLHHVQKDPKDWESFFALAENDKMNVWCLELVESFFRAGYTPLFVTGRGQEEEKLTLRWLNRFLIDADTHDVKLGSFPLYMRPKGDRRPDTVIKAELYKKEIEPYYEVLFAVDDKSSVARMWRSMGVPALQCAHWEEDAAPNVHQEISKFFVERDAK